MATTMGYGGWSRSWGAVATRPHPSATRPPRTASVAVEQVPRDHGCAVERCVGEAVGPIDARLLQAFWKAYQDPEDAFFEWLATRQVWMGVDEKMPRTPAVFERKFRWKLPELEGDH